MATKVKKEKENVEKNNSVDMKIKDDDNTLIEVTIQSSLSEKLQYLKSLVYIMQKNENGHNFKFVSETSILLAINNEMLRLGITLTPCFKPNTLKSEIVKYINANGTEKTDVLVTSEMSFIWRDIRSDEMITIDWALVGQQADGSQALGSGLTYANRYFLLKYFNIATSEDDPDKIRGEIAAAEERKKISSIQTKIKKCLEKLIKIYKTQEKIYEILGTNKEQFTKDYNTPDKQQNMLEQLELVLKGDSNA